MVSKEISKNVFRVVIDKRTNVYIIRTSIGAALIDAGGDRKATEVISALGELGLGLDDIKIVLLTHRHSSHIEGAQVFAEAEVYLHRNDIGAVPSKDNLLNVLTKPFKKEDARPTFKPLKGYDFIPFGERNFLALHTPGHTSGSVCYLCGDLLFTGDTLLNTHGLRLGNAHEPSPTPESLVLSLRKLRDYVFYFICPGHGEIVKDGKMGLYRFLENFPVG